MQGDDPRTSSAHEKSIVIPPDARGLNTDQASLYTSISTSWLTKARINQTSVPGPKFVTVGRRCIYRREDLDAFLDAAGGA